MTLLTCVFAALIATICWYRTAGKEDLKLGVLCWLYWGASLMWLVDAVIGYFEEGAAFFNPAPEELLNDLSLGLSVVALGLVILIVVLLIRDPRGAVRASLLKKTEK